MPGMKLPYLFFLSPLNEHVSTSCVSLWEDWTPNIKAVLPLLCVSVPQEGSVTLLQLLLDSPMNLK